MTLLTITDAQVTRLYTIASKYGWTQQSIKNLLKIVYPDTFTEDAPLSTTLLSQEQYEEVIDFICRNPSLVVNPDTYVSNRFYRINSACADENNPVIEAETIEQHEVPVIQIVSGSSLNPGQTQALESLKDWWKNSCSSIFFLDGYAGTGKTYLVRHFLDWLKEEENNSNIVLSSPWNKPTRVLTQSVGRDDLDSMTLYRALGLILDLTDEGTHKVGKGGSDKAPAIDSYSLAVVDEIGVVDDELLHRLLQTKTRLLCLGDRLQLPPVGLVESTIFSYFREIQCHTAKLTKIERYDPNSGLGMAVNYAIECLENEQEFHTANLKTFQDDATLIYVPAKKFSDELSNYVSSNLWYQENGDPSVSLAFSNNAVDTANQIIRSRLIQQGSIRIKDGHEEWTQGEEVVFSKPIFEDGMQLFSNGDRATIIDVVETLIETSLGNFPGYLVSFSAPTLTGLHTLTKISRKSKEEFLSRAETLKEKALEAKPGQRKLEWGKYYGFLGKDAPFNHVYSETIHKSQGSTYPIVWIAGNSIRVPAKNAASKKDAERMKTSLWYVALSRAKKCVFFCI